MGRVWNYIFAKEIQTWKKIQQHQRFSRNWGFTRAYLSLLLLQRPHSLSCTYFLTFLRLHSMFCFCNCRRSISISPLIEIREIVQKNIIYLLYMPPNNVTLFLSTFCWFSFRKRINFRGFALVNIFFSSDFFVSNIKFHCENYRREEGIFFLEFCFIEERHVKCNQKNIHNEILLVFPIDVVYHNFFFVHIRNQTPSNKTSKDSMPAAFVVFICLWIDGNLYGFRFLCHAFFSSSFFLFMALHLFCLTGVFDTHTHTHTAPSMHYNHVAAPFIYSLSMYIIYYTTTKKNIHDIEYSKHVGCSFFG